MNKMQRLTQRHKNHQKQYSLMKYSDREKAKKNPMINLDINVYLLVLSTYISLCNGLSTLLLIKINGSNRVYT